MKKFLTMLLVFSSLIYAKRLVVLEPSIVEIIYRLGGEDQIVAISKMKYTKIYPYDKTDKLESAGNYSKPNIEKIVSLKPDLVIANYHTTKIEEQMKRFGIKTAKFKASKMGEIYNNIQRVGKILGKEQKAEKLVEELKQRISKIDTSRLKGKKAIFLFSSAPMMAFNKDTLPGNILKVLGLKDLSDGVKGSRPIITQEYILTKNPDFVIVSTGMGDTSDILDVNPMLKKTTAGKNDAVYFVPASEYLRGTYRIIDPIEKLSKMLNKKQT